MLTRLQLTLWVTLLASLFVGPFISSAYAKNTCERPFSITVDAHVLALHKSEVVSQSTVNFDLEQDLLVNDAPTALKRILKSRSKFRVQKTELKLSRTSVEGTPYTAAYTKWVPMDREKPIGTVVLQHGFSRSSRYFHDMTLMLASIGFEVIAQDGVNIGKTLAYTAQDFPDNQGFVTAPSPVNDSLTLRNIILNENLSDFVLLGHSRGHAVTSVIAAMSDIAPRINAHFSVNPYTRWLVDEIYEDPFSNPLGVPRSTLNALGATQLQEMTMKSLKERAPHERFSENDIKLEEKAVLEIAAGLRGLKSDAPGFNTLPLYGIAEKSKTSSPNDFGLERAGIGEINDSVLKRTFVLYGASDTLVKPQYLKGITKVPGVRSRSIKSGDHYLPNKNPGLVVDYMIRSIRELQMKQGRASTRVRD